MPVSFARLSVKHRPGQGGFTMIEMLVVIAVLAVLATLALIGLGAMKGNANREACRVDVDTYQAAVDIRNVYGGSIPTLSELTSGPNSLIKRPSRFAATMSIDPLTGDVSNSQCPTP